MFLAQRLWLRKVDDTFTISEHDVNDTLKELNDIHSAITFTAEEEANEQLPFLDCLLKIESDRKLKTKVYKKVTHTGQYINYHSNQPLAVKLSTITNLTKRAKNLCTDPHDFNEELTYIRKTMELNDFPENIVKKTIKNHLKKRDKPRKENDEVQQQIPLYLPYEKGISEKISRLAKKYNVKVVN